MGFEPATLGLGSRLDVLSLPFAIVRRRLESAPDIGFCGPWRFYYRSSWRASARPLSGGCNGGGSASHAVAGAGQSSCRGGDLVTGVPCARKRSALNHGPPFPG